MIFLYSLHGCLKNRVMQAPAIKLGIRFYVEVCSENIIANKNVNIGFIIL